MTHIVTCAACARGALPRTMYALVRIPHPIAALRMPLDDRELMLWALAHGWSVKVILGDAPGSLWRDPARRRHLVHGTGASPELPVLSDDVRARMHAARAAAPPLAEPLPAG